MICCVDVDYADTGVTSACVAFDDWGDAVARIELVVRAAGSAAPYRPGAFYERELPYLLAALDRMPPIDIVLVDAYVQLGPDHPGLGGHLHAYRGGIVVGVAKTQFVSADAIEVVRGTSARPLYVTAAGMDPAIAGEHVRTMHGEHRVPTMIKLADALARGRR